MGDGKEKERGREREINLVFISKLISVPLAPVLRR